MYERLFVRESCILVSIVLTKVKWVLIIYLEGICLEDELGKLSCLEI